MNISRLFFVRRPVATTLLTVRRSLSRASFAYHPAAGFAAAAGRLSDHQRAVRTWRGASPETIATSSVADSPGAPPRPNRRRDGDDFAAVQVGSTQHYPAVRPQPPYIWTVRPATSKRRINAAHVRICPPALRSNPTYRKQNPADTPIMVLALTSDNPDSSGQLYDTASNGAAAAPLASSAASATSSLGGSSPCPPSAWS